MTMPDRRSGIPQRGALPVGPVITAPAVAHSRIEALSREGQSAAAIEEADSYYSSLPWYANFAATCLDPGERLRLYELSSGTDQPIVLFLRERADRFGPLPARTLASLTNYYSCGFSITGLDSAADGSTDGAGRIANWARELRRGKNRPDRIAFDALDAPSPSFDALVAGLRDAGYLVETYPQFGNWYLTVHAPDFDAYWAGRDARLRNTVERKERKLRREHQMTMEIVDAPNDAERAIAAYEEVYAQSWKTPEPYGTFIPGLIRTGFATAVATVGLLRLEDRPVAAQLWIRHRHRQQHRATIFKLAHTESAKQFSVGSILTRHMMRHAFENGRGTSLREIDFGRGDDPYKRLWLPERRQRWGVIAYEPATLAGLAYAVRNLGPKAVRRLARRLLRR
ncbi:GNAT family N-acetyltransferase [Rhodospirillaceae bacterium SYSU D60014]|uniref:GNAT family N-acetyltransferase n=1 Tax=Virgifigura deserti TaxID=2268457 RepID=UPI000E66CCCF